MVQTRKKAKASKAPPKEKAKELTLSELAGAMSKEVRA
jgi:hypothetical protein